VVSGTGRTIEQDNPGHQSFLARFAASIATVIHTSR